MIFLVATLTINESKTKEFEALGKELVNNVVSNESGCIFYNLTKSAKPNTYTFIEQYADEAAIELHRSTDYFKDIGRKMVPLMEGERSLERYEKIA